VESIRSSHADVTRPPSGETREQHEQATARDQPDLHVVLVAPEIPPNTGTTARLCAATTTRLHLVGPLGFSLEDRYLKRAGLDYWPFVDLHVHQRWAGFESLHHETSNRIHFKYFSVHAGRSYAQADFAPGDFLVFGSETKGLGKDFLLPRASAAYR